MTNHNLFLLLRINYFWESLNFIILGELIKNNFSLHQTRNFWRKQIRQIPIWENRNCFTFYFFYLFLAPRHSSGQQCWRRWCALKFNITLAFILLEYISRYSSLGYPSTDIKTFWEVEPSSVNGRIRNTCRRWRGPTRCLLSSWFPVKSRSSHVWQIKERFWIWKSLRFWT